MRLRIKYLLKGRFIVWLPSLLMMSLAATFSINAWADNTVSGSDKLEEVTDNCRANYSINDGDLYIPCVDVLGTEVRSQAMRLQLVSSTEPWEFVTTDEDISDSNSTAQNCRATLNEGELFIPCIDVLDSNGGDTQTYEAKLEQTAFGKSLRFTVININEADNSLARKQRRSTRRESYGTVLGDFNGVRVYSNSSSDYASGERSIVNGKDVGLKWQCVEYVNRYYLKKFGINLRDKHSNHAKTFWGNASKMQLDRFNNGGTTAPEIGDIAVSDSGTYGHVAIVRSVSNNQMCVAQQNVYQTSNDVNACTTLSISNGQYTVGHFDNTTLPITGWLRLKTVDISRNGQNIVDDKEDALWNGGTQSYWKIGYNTGYDSRVLYTYANASQNEDNYCKWNVNIVDAGNYEVSAYVPSNYATSQQAKYKIWTGNQVEYSTINQQDYSNQWVKLGEYNFQAGIASIKLSDNTGETYSLKPMIACDAIKFTYKASNDSGYQWHGNGSLISYHGRDLPTEGSRAFGIIRDTVQLHKYSGKPVGLFQWQVNQRSCNKLKLYAEGLPSIENRVDITMGTWSDRSSDITFSNVKLPFILGKSNTGWGARFQMENGKWYVVKVALRNVLSQDVQLHAICTTESPTVVSYRLGGGDSAIIDGGYKWNGSGSVISHMFSGSYDMGGDWPHGAFKDTLKVRRSPEKPMLFFQWQRDDICPRLTFDAELGVSEKRVDIHVKNWSASNDAATVHRSVTLPYTLSDYSDDGSWRVIQIKFLKPVSYTANVTAKCPGID
jgi:surface antigen